MGKRSGLISVCHPLTVGLHCIEAVAGMRLALGYEGVCVWSCTPQEAYSPQTWTMGCLHGICVLLQTSVVSGIIEARSLLALH